MPMSNDRPLKSAELPFKASVFIQPIVNINRRCRIKTPQTDAFQRADPTIMQVLGLRSPPSA